MVGEEHSYDWKLLDEENAQTTQLKLGGCEYLVTVDDIVTAALNTPNVVFCPHDQQYPLVDFAYSKVVLGERVVYFFQATTGETHKSDTTRIKNLENACGGPSRLHVHYLVVPNKFDKFGLTFKDGQRRNSDNATRIKSIRIVKVLGSETEPVLSTIVGGGALTVPAPAGRAAHNVSPVKRRRSLSY
jgi:hypothetical protein